MENFASQIRALMDGLGTRMPWTRHTNDAEITDHEGETIYFQTTAHVLEYH